MPQTNQIILGSRGHSLGAHVESVIRSRISAGVYPPASRLPTRRSFCDEFHIAPGTLDQAIKVLLADGTLRTVERRGTFVADTITPGSDTQTATKAASANETQSKSARRVGIVDTGIDLHTMRPEVNWFEYMIVHALEEKLSALGGQPVYAQSAKAEGTTERLFDSIDYLVGRGVHALVIVAYHERPVDIDGAIARADHAGVPVVVVSASNRQWAASNIWTDYRIAGRHAAEHLIENGHRRIVFIGAFTYEYQQQRIDGALDALRAAGCDSSYLTVVIPQPGEHLWDCMTDEAADAGDTLFVRAYETLPQFDAVIAANDWMGAGIVRASQRLGLTPGRAIAVVGFDDQLIARKCDMTTVRFPLERLGIEAAIMAFRAIGGDAQRHRLHIESCLIPRGSTATDVLENARHA